jgi:hypothetical protein
MRVKLQLVMCNDEGHEETVVYLRPADKYPRLIRRPSQGQKGLDERALMAS